jgi:hypothetical protein
MAKVVIESSLHKEIVGSVNGTPYKVIFDEENCAIVEKEVAEQLEALGACKIVQDPYIDPSEVEVKKTKKTKTEKSEGSDE